MTKIYVVQDAGDTVRDAKVQLAGKDVTASVKTFHAQLVPEDGHGAAIQLPSFDATDEDRALLVDGARIKVTLEAA